MPPEPFSHPVQTADEADAVYPRIGDACGQALLDCLAGKKIPEIVERDDGLIFANNPFNMYLDPYDSWIELSRRAIKHAKGKVLDIGCGAGRHAIFLQQCGYDVVGLDISAGSLEVARRQGLQKTFHGTIEGHLLENPLYDTFLLLGSNLSLLASSDYAQRMLGTLARMAAPGAIIIGQTIDPSQLHDPVYVEYYERNQKQGRPPGQMRYRVRYLNIATPWFFYLYSSPSELELLVKESAWKLLEVEQEKGNPFYTAILLLS